MYRKFRHAGLIEVERDNAVPSLDMELDLTERRIGQGITQFLGGFRRLRSSSSINIPPVVHLNHRHFASLVIDSIDDTVGAHAHVEQTSNLSLK